MTGKQGFRRFRPKLVSLAVASCFVTSAVLANPTNPQVVQGVKSITGLNTPSVLVTTSAHQAIINWGSFSINVGELTRFQQLSASSAVLNRVAAGNPSQILGALSSNGRVLLVNPSGIIFGAGAQIDVAALVATSLNISNADFIAKYRDNASTLKFTDVAGAGAVVNQGNITTGTGGEVYLVGPAVTNNGIITSPKGEVVLAAGNSVELVNPGTPNLRVEISAAENEARNLGQIISESGRVGIYAGLINNSGTVNASSAVAQGGKILLKATKRVDLESTSILDASGAGGGRIDVLAKNGGTVNVAGKLDASAPVKGNGGFIETSGDIVKVADGTVVTTDAPNGKTGMWLIDPGGFRIAAYGGDMSGATLKTTLNSTDFTVVSDNGAYGGANNVEVADAVSWGSAHSLTLIAREDVFVDQAITNTGTGGINIYAGWNGTSPISAPVVSSVTGDIMVAAPISTLGDVKLIAGGHAQQIFDSSGAITANGLRIDSLGTNANFDLNANSVNTLSGQSVNGFFFTNNKTLTIGTVGGLSGITVNSPAGAVVNLSISGASAKADLNVNGNITAIAGGGGSNGSISLFHSGSYGGDINVNGATLTATGSNFPGQINLNHSGPSGNINISGSKLAANGDGGEGGSITAFANNGGVSIANSTLTANSAGTTSCCSPSSQISVSGNTVSIANSTLEANGPSGNASYGGWNGGVDVNGDSGVTITGSTLRGRGGDGASGGSGGVEVHSGTGTLDIKGGSLIEALGGKGSSGQGGAAELELTSNSISTLKVTDSTVRAIAGTGTSSDGSGSVRINDSASDITITNSNIRADGAEGQIRVAAVGKATISGSSFTAKGNGAFSESFVDVEASKISVSNSTFTVNHVTNAPDEPGTSEASVYMYANGSGGLSISGSTIDVSATGTAPGNALADLGSGLSGGSVAIGNSTIKASGLGGAIMIGSDTGNVSVTNSTVAATGKTGLDGDMGLVRLMAFNGSIDTSGSALSATGRTLADGGASNVMMIANGDITLGSLASNDFVEVNSKSGRIIDGNSTGANVTAPVADLIAATGIGTTGDPLETGIADLLLDTLNGEIGIANQGNLILANLFNGGTGTSTVGTTGTMVFASPIEVSGSLNLLANNGMVVEQNIFSGGNLLLDSGIGDLGFTGVTVQGANVTLQGRNIFVGFDTSTAPTSVGASNLMKVTTLGNLNVLGGANPSANAELHGGLEVNLTVGQLAGFVNVAGGAAGASAQISAGSPDTINLFFPTLSAGGFFVNGVEGAISSGNTGFFVNGAPAVLGGNFFVTYGAAELPPDVQLAINQTIANTNQQTQLGDIGNETGGVGETKEEKEKKQLPVCSR